VGKWAGLSACFALFGLWVTLINYSAKFTLDAATQIRMNHGMIGVGRHVGPPSELAAYLGSFPPPRRGWTWTRATPNPMFESLRRRWGLQLPIIWSPVLSSAPYPNVRWQVFYFPLWIPFLIFALPTAFVWYRDRRRIPVGHCGRCGYDLTKNESGVCPECGVVCEIAKQVIT